MKNVRPPKKLKDATLCFLIRGEKDHIQQICLAMKKRGFGKGLWNGVGGKVIDKYGETIESAAIRETYEEIKVEILNLNKVAELTFLSPYAPEDKDWDQLVHVFFVKKWKGIPKETEEMKPKWYSVENLPYKSMWVDDKYWLPKVLTGKLLKALFVFGKGNSIVKSNVKSVSNFI